MNTLPDAVRLADWVDSYRTRKATVLEDVATELRRLHKENENLKKAANREQEPFIYVREDNEKPFGGFEHCSETDAGAIPVYTAPMLYTPRPKREWVGLTEEEMSALWVEYHGDNCIADGRIPKYEKALEAKLKEKNNG